MCLVPLGPYAPEEGNARGMMWEWVGLSPLRDKGEGYVLWVGARGGGTRKGDI